jgi:hypothetical protein
VRPSLLSSISRRLPSQADDSLSEDIGLFLVGLSMILIMSGITTYLLDFAGIFAASALAATTCLRSLFGFAFPLFAPYSTFCPALAPQNVLTPFLQCSRVLGTAAAVLSSPESLFSSGGAA